MKYFKNAIFLCLGCCFSLTSFGQKGNASIDIVSGIDYSFRHVGSLTVSSQADETPRMKWRAGFNFNQRISNRMFLKTGLRFANMGYYGGKFQLRWGSQHDENGGWAPNPLDPNLPNELQVNNSYYFLEIPVMLRYEFSGQKLRCYVEAGVSPHYYIGVNREQITDLYTKIINEEMPTSFNKFQLSGNLAFGVNYTLSSRYQLFGQSTFRYHLTRLHNSVLSERLYTLGMEMGLRYRL